MWIPSFRAGILVLVCIAALTSAAESTPNSQLKQWRVILKEIPTTIDHRLAVEKCIDAKLETSLGHRNFLVFKPQKATFETTECSQTYLETAPIAVTAADKFPKTHSRRISRKSTSTSGLRSASPNAFGESQTTSAHFRVTVATPVKKLRRSAIKWARSPEDLVRSWKTTFGSQIDAMVIDPENQGNKIFVEVVSDDDDVVTRIKAGIAEDPEVLLIENGRKFGPLNKHAVKTLIGGPLTATTGVQPAANNALWDQGITGTGEIIGVSDTGIDTDSCFFFQDTDQPLPVNTVDMTRRKIISYRYQTGSLCGLGMDEPCGDTIDEDGHGTHTAGSIAGKPHTGPGGVPIDPRTMEYSGGAKDAKLVFTDIGWQSSFQGTEAFDALVLADRSAGARIHSASWGCVGDLQNLDQCNNYMSFESDLDSTLFDVEDSLVLVAAGNDGDSVVLTQTVGAPATAKNVLSIGATQSTQFHITDSMAHVNPNVEVCQWAPHVPCCNATHPTFQQCTQDICCANGIYECCPSLFASQHHETLAVFSSTGPTRSGGALDGRFKPDLVAPGQFIVSASSDYNLEDPLVATCAAPPNPLLTSSPFPAHLPTATLSGTSMSTPLVAGIAALVRQYFRDGFYPSGTATPANARPFVSAALLKATMVTSAQPLTGKYNANQSTGLGGVDLSLLPSPNVYAGFGRPEVHRALPFSGSPFKLLAHDVRHADLGPGGGFMASGETRTYTFSGLKSDAPFVATLAWMDPEAAPLTVGSVLINDLDIVAVVTASTNLAMHTVGEEFAPNALSTGVKDTVNNIERITIPPSVGAVPADTFDLTLTVTATSISAAPSTPPPQGYAVAATGTWLTSTEPPPATPPTTQSSTPTTMPPTSTPPPLPPTTMATPAPPLFAGFPLPHPSEPFTAFFASDIGGTGDDLNGCTNHLTDACATLARVWSVARTHKIANPLESVVAFVGAGTFSESATLQMDTCVSVIGRGLGQTTLELASSGNGYSVAFAADCDAEAFPPMFGHVTIDRMYPGFGSLHTQYALHTFFPARNLKFSHLRIINGRAALFDVNRGRNFWITDLVLDVAVPNGGTMQLTSTQNIHLDNSVVVPSAWGTILAFVTNEVGLATVDDYRTHNLTIGPNLVLLPRTSTSHPPGTIEIQETVDHSDPLALQANAVLSADGGVTRYDSSSNLDTVSQHVSVFLPPSMCPMRTVLRTPFNAPAPNAHKILKMAAVSPVAVNTEILREVVFAGLASTSWRFSDASSVDLCTGGVVPPVMQSLELPIVDLEFLDSTFHLPQFVSHPAITFGQSGLSVWLFLNNISPEFSTPNPVVSDIAGTSSIFLDKDSIPPSVVVTILDTEMIFPMPPIQDSPPFPFIDSWGHLVVFFGTLPQTDTQVFVNGVEWPIGPVTVSGSPPPGPVIFTNVGSRIAFPKRIFGGRVALYQFWALDFGLPASPAAFAVDMYRRREMGVQHASSDLFMSLNGTVANGASPPGFDFGGIWFPIREQVPRFGLVGTFTVFPTDPLVPIVIVSSGGNFNFFPDTEEEGVRRQAVETVTIANIAGAGNGTFIFEFNDVPSDISLPANTSHFIACDPPCDVCIIRGAYFISNATGIVTGCRRTEVHDSVFDLSLGAKIVAPDQQQHAGFFEHTKLIIEKCVISDVV